MVAGWETHHAAADGRVGVHVRVQLLPAGSHHHVSIHLVPHAVAAVWRKAFDLRQRGGTAGATMGSFEQKAIRGISAPAPLCDTRFTGPRHTHNSVWSYHRCYRCTTLEGFHGNNCSRFDRKYSTTPPPLSSLLCVSVLCVCVFFFLLISPA